MTLVVIIKLNGTGVGSWIPGAQDLGLFLTTSYKDEIQHYFFVLCPSSEAAEVVALSFVLCVILLQQQIHLDLQG